LLVLSVCYFVLYTLFAVSLLRFPPYPALFPYTTLFRSRLAGSIGIRSARHIEGDAPHAAGEERHHLHLARSDMLDERLGEPHRTDRKSTRLNSSHQITSYAVFCLNKKRRKRPQLSRLLT